MRSRDAAAVTPGFRAGRIDLAVVGSGFAAAAAAALAAWRGASVAVLRRPGPPPGFGEVIDDGGLAALADAGLAAAAAPALGEPVARLLLRWPPHSEALQELPGHGRIVDPERLTGTLLDAARVAGAWILDGTDGLDVRRHGGSWQLVGGALSAPVAADRIIDASGQGAWAAAHGLERRAIYSLAAVHALGHRVGACGRERAGILVSAGPEGWLYRLGYSGPRLVGGIFRHRTPTSPQQVRALATRLMTTEDGRACSALSARVVHCQLAFARRGHGPGWIAIGAAALGLDPLSGQGISWALDSARRAVEACLRGEEGGAALRDYEDFRLARLRHAHRSARDHYGAAARAFGTPFWTETRDAIEAATLPGRNN